MPRVLPAGLAHPHHNRTHRAEQCCHLPLVPNDLERRSRQTRTLALQVHTRPITEPGAPPCPTAGGGEPRKQACSMPDAPADQAQLAVGFKELSEHPTQAVRVESSTDPSCPAIGNVHLSMSLPRVRTGPGNPGIQW